MAIALKTSHALYANVTAFICVDTDGTTIIDAKGAQTLTPHANVTRGTGTYGRHFRTNLVSSNAEGVAMSPGILTKPLTGASANQGTTLVVINNGVARANRGTVFNSAQVTTSIGPGVFTGDAVGLANGSGNPGTLGTTDVIGTGAHSFAVGVDAGNSKVWVDGLPENSTATSQGNASDTAYATYIGGNTTGGFGGLSADYVYIVQFNKLLTDAEIADLRASLGANNTFGLIEAPVPVSSDLTPNYAVNAFVSADVNGSYGMWGEVSADMGALYNVSDGTSVSGDLTALFAVYANITADLGSTFKVHVSVSQDLTASYSVASAGLFTSDVWINNTDMPWAPGTSVKWTWVSAGRVGALSGKTLNEGTAALNGASRLALSGLPTGPGFLLGAVQGADAANDQPFYQGGAVA